LSADEQTRLLAESREKLQHDIDAWVYVAEEKGLKKGLERGREEGREEGRKDAQLVVVRNLLARGMAIEEIQKITTLSQKDIQSLLH
jgi:predicted transposase/invertase (TIGR01784 family)